MAADFTGALCPVCRNPLTWVPQYAQWYCYNCRQYRTPAQTTPPPVAAQPAPQPAAHPATAGGLWYQNAYRLRKKVLALAAQYWIEDAGGRPVGYSKQKLFKLKEDIRVYTDEGMQTELFRIQQQQIMDTWGNFAVIDSATNAVLGYVRRRAVSSAFVRDEWEVQDVAHQLIGGIYESTGRGLARKWLPGGGLIPEKMTLELQGRPVAEINQQFQIIGDIWEIQCKNVGSSVDRRVLLGCALLMSMIERARK